MIRFFKKAMAFLFDCEESADDRPQPTTELERIVSNIARWEARAADYERRGCPTLARDLRASIKEYRRHVAACRSLGKVA